MVRLDYGDCRLWSSVIDRSYCEPIQKARVFYKIMIKHCSYWTWKWSGKPVILSRILLSTLPRYTDWNNISIIEIKILSLPTFTYYKFIESFFPIQIFWIDFSFATVCRLQSSFGLTSSTDVSFLMDFSSPLSNEPNFSFQSVRINKIWQTDLQLTYFVWFSSKDDQTMPLALTINCSNIWPGCFL